MDRSLLGLMIWLFFLGGLFGFAVGLTKLLGGGDPSEYGVMGIGGGFWMLSSAIVIYIRAQLPKA